MNTGTFIANIIISVLINFGINFGFGWATVSKWGRLQQGHFEGMPVWVMNPEINSCIILDMMLTCFFMGFFTVLLATDGIVRDIKDGKTRPVDTEVTKTWFWALTPVRVEGLCLRALLTALEMCVVVGLPTTLFVFAGVQGGEFPGVGYAVFKGFFAFFAAVPIFLVMFFSASDSRNFIRAAYSALDDKGAKEIPLVGGVSRV